MGQYMCIIEHMYCPWNLIIWETQVHTYSAVLYQFISEQQLCDIQLFIHPGGAKFVLNGITYQNNSIVSLEDIGEGDDALLCTTNFRNCCRPPYTGGALGNWFFPNETRVQSSGKQWDFHRTRGRMVVKLHRRRGGVEGIYRCEIPDAMNDIQTIYIGVYNITGKPLLTH